MNGKVNYRELHVAWRPWHIVFVKTSVQHGLREIRHEPEVRALDTEGARGGRQEEREETGSKRQGKRV